MGYSNKVLDLIEHMYEVDTRFSKLSDRAEENRRLCAVTPQTE
jgi:hypothetical protein